MCTMARLLTCLTLLSLFTFTIVNGEIFCFNCTDIGDPTNCHSIIKCGDNVTDCHAEKTARGGQTLYTLSCDTTERCPKPTQSTTSLTTILTPTHANTSSSVSDLTTHSSTNPTTTSATMATASHSAQNSQNAIVGRRSDRPSCSLCCATDECNKFLCQDSGNSNSSKCEDNPTCETVYAVVPKLCDDVHTAKKICKLKCNLCDLVDGAWGNWKEWGSCSLSCGNGTTSRTRECDNPRPAGRGDNCTGDGIEEKYCNERDCPEDGNWSDWGTWSECSVTCGIGLQRRDRNCSDPVPDPDGHECDGDSRDDRICEQPECHDGQWQVWGDWTGCTKTCGYGVKTRFRNCSADKHVGHVCDGDPFEVDLCRDDLLCEESAFDVTGLAKKTDAGNDSIVLTMVLTNIGDNYNTSTGVFVCKIPGLYNFFISIEKQMGSSQANCQLMVDNVPKLTVVARSSMQNAENLYVRASNAVLLLLHTGNLVYLGNCSDPQTFSNGSTFSGFLVKAL